MDIKLICIDMDGTLLNPDDIVSDENKAAIKSAVDKGVHVAITTGRLYNCAKLYAESINLQTPIIASNGAFIGGTNGQEIYKNTLTLADLKDFINTMEKYNLYWYCSTNYGLLSIHPFPETNIYYKLNQTLPPDQQIQLEVLNSPQEIFEQHGEHILKAVCVDKTNHDKLMQAKEELKAANPHLEIVSSWGDNFEVMKKGSSKGEAVKALTQYFNLTPDNVMCIGDSENDLSMLKFASLG
ncbi:MAG TPA: Cof-type HAD-IIB family hydrolase, partial [Firmicutes bacterium]|nr:Cof-type HAD-IIB family hydrolase [Bacillota bacterium]